MSALFWGPREKVNRTVRRSLVAVAVCLGLWTLLVVWAIRNPEGLTPLLTGPPEAAPPTEPSRSAESDLTFETLQRELPVYPESQLVPVGPPSRVDGVPLVMGSFETQDKPDTVMAHYARHFNARHWWWLNTDELAAQGFVYPAMTGTDLATRYQYSVMVMPHDEGSTVMLSVADLANARTDPRAEVDGLPRYPDTTPFVLAAQGPEQAVSVVAFETRSSEAEVKAFYAEAMRRAGYQQAQDEGGLPLMRFTRETLQWVLAMTSKDGKTMVTAQRSLKESP